jgi:hypothetical protein
LERIEKGAFEKCKELREVVLPASVRFIGASAFAGCEELKRVVIGKGVEKIEKNAFKGCKNLVIVTEETEQPKGWLESKKKSWNPDGCKVVWGDKE